MLVFENYKKRFIKIKIFLINITYNYNSNNYYNILFRFYFDIVSLFNKTKYNIFVI